MCISYQRAIKSNLTNLMSDKTPQFVQLLMLNLSETNTDKDECLLKDIRNFHPNYNARYNEMVKTRTIPLIPVIETKKTSDYKHLLQVLNNGLTFNSRPQFLYYSNRVATIIVFGFSTSVFSNYLIHEIIG